MGWKIRTKQKRSSGGQKAQTNRRVRLDAAAAAEQVALGAAQALEPAGQEQAGLLEQGPAGSGLLEQPTTSSSPATSSSSPAVACDCTDSRAHLCAADAVSCLACDQCGMRAPPIALDGRIGRIGRIASLGVLSSPQIDVPFARASGRSSTARFNEPFILEPFIEYY